MEFLILGTFLDFLKCFIIKIFAQYNNNRLVTLDGFCKVIKEVAMSSGLPIIADADTGFGEGEMCAKTVWDYF